MKKVMMMLMLLMMISSVCADTIYMKNANTLHGRIFGKADEYVYIESDPDVYRIRIEAIEKIYDDRGVDITRQFLKEDDFMNTVTNQEGLSNASKESFVAPKDLPAKARLKQPIINIEEMTDREFQQYMNAQQTTEIKKISDTMFIVWGISIGIGLISLLVVSSM